MELVNSVGGWNLRKNPNADVSSRFLQASAPGEEYAELDNMAYHFFLYIHLLGSKILGPRKLVLFQAPAD